MGFLMIIDVEQQHTYNSIDSIYQGHINILLSQIDFLNRCLIQQNYVFSCQLQELRQAFIHELEQQRQEFNRKFEQQQEMFNAEIIKLLIENMLYKITGHNYKDVDDPAVRVSFPLIGDPTIKFVSWTTTP
ncbi:unnamed protein product [Rotaria sp. Silwood1]|nr:unnamed protein product [Rotaria sp. Silwood1]